MPKLDSNAAWKEATRLVAANREVLFILAGVFFFLPSLLQSVVLGEPQVEAGADTDAVMATMTEFYSRGWWLILLGSLVQVVGLLAVLRLTRDRQRPTVAEAIQTGFSGLPTYFLAQVLFVVGIALVGGLLVGLAAMVLPPLAAIMTLLLLVFLAFAAVRMILVAPIVAIEGERNPIAALRRSWALTRGNFWRILAFLLLVAVLFIVVLSVVMLLVGIVLALISEGELQRVLASAVSGALTALAVLYFVGIIAAIHRQLTAGKIGINEPA